MPADVLKESLFRLGEWVAENGIEADGPYRAARDLLLGNPPRIRDGSGDRLLQQGEGTLEASRRLVLELDGGVLPIQGPPGCGKTYRGARMICDLVRAKKTVGITAVSHKVIRNLIDKTLEAAQEEGLSFECIQKVGRKSEEEHPAIKEVVKNEDVAAALKSGEVQVAAGTAWLWAREEMAETVDVLFVDEAGQMSLANVLAVAPAARNIVLLGDPQQLEQPQQGSHPEGAGVAALEHVFADHKTMPKTQGLFLGETWRLHPEICAYTSELFYEGRLHSREALERQQLVGDGPFEGAGLWFVPVDHEGNVNSSPEEVACIAELLAALTGGGTLFQDADGKRSPLRLSDILIVAPYNAQVAALAERMPDARIGTVDKFQGQEAPVVIYSMTTSSPEEAPRGMEFLYSLNRRNVATSRAQCACILVANARLLEPKCRSPQQMKLANAFCRYVEVSQGFLG